MADDGFDNMEEERSLRKTNNQGGGINYSRSNIMFKELDEYEKMNYALFMMKYNVQDKKEVGEGAAEFKAIEKPTDIIKIDKSVFIRIVNMMTFLSFLMVIIIFVFWICFYIAGIFVNINSVKKTMLLYTGIFLICLLGLTYILDYMYNKTFDRIEIIHSYIR